MTIEDLRNNITLCLGDQASIELYFLTADSLFCRTNINKETAAEMLKAYKDNVMGAIGDGAAVLSISSSDIRGGAFYEIDIPELPEFLKNLKLLCEGNVEAQPFTHDIGIYKIRYIIAIIGDTNNRLMLVKKFAAVNLYKASYGFYAFVSGQGDTIKKIESDFIRIDGKFELMCANGRFLANDLTMVEDKLGLTGILRKEAKKEIEKLYNLNILYSKTGLENATDDKVLARKLSRIATDSYLAKALSENIVTTNNVIEFIERDLTYSKHLKIKNGKIDIKANNNKTATKYLIKLFNEDLLTSGLTGNRYDSGSKTKID